MRKNIFGRQLSRDTNERKALFKSLASALVMNERIHTTHAKAKAIRPYIEKLITQARSGGMSGSRLVEPYLTKPALEKMMSQVAPRFIGRPGGYTRIVYTGTRIADNAPVALIEFVEKGQAITPEKKVKGKKTVTAKASAVVAKSATKKVVSKKPVKAAKKEKKA